MIRSFEGLGFEHIGQIEPQRGPTGPILEHTPQARFRDAEVTKLHAYGAGPFCRFRIGRRCWEAGLYVVTVDGAPVYVDECEQLDRRWGSNGYGGISPRNCFRGGQPTNCRVNAAILRAAKDQQKIDLWFHSFGGDRETRREIEARLIHALLPS